MIIFSIRSAAELAIRRAEAGLPVADQELRAGPGRARCSGSRPRSLSVVSQQPARRRGLTAEEAAHRK